MLFPRRKWKDIEGYEGLYQVSNLGEVRSLKFNKVKKRKPGKQQNGYLFVGLCKDGKRKNYFIHRLVAQAFILNLDNYPCVNHKDENKTNNIWTNLEWCTLKYNANYGTRNERVGKAHKGAKHSKAKKVQMIDKETGDILKVFDCVADANEYLGKNRHNHNIHLCVRGETKTAYGYIWRYIINN